MLELEQSINQAWQEKDNLSIKDFIAKYRTPIETAITQIETNEIRVADNIDGNWLVNVWVKQAVLLYFKINTNQPIAANYTQFYDKIPLQFQQCTSSDFEQLQIRIVPPAVVRRGAYIGPNTVLMPSYVNIGANVGKGTMVDSWATIGSCAQIGEYVHISGGVGIGGILEPLQAQPTIIEDNCFIGARSEIVEGVIVERGSVISMGVFIGQSTKIYDREKDEVSYGRIPAGSVVVPGTLPSKNGKYNLACAIIVKKVDEKTRKKVGINHLLREAANV